MTDKEIAYASGIFKSALSEEPFDFRKNKMVSYSQYSKYQKCPLQWKLRYIDKHKEDENSIIFVFGTAMHETIQMYITKLYTVSIKAANEMDLDSLLRDRLLGEYKRNVESNGNVHFSSKDEIFEYYSDGCEILKEIKRRRKEYFPSNREAELVGIELPLYMPAISGDPTLENIILMSSLDVVLYYKESKTYKIIDIKTSTSGWSDWKKKDKDVTNQLLLYKTAFANKYNIDIDKVDVSFLILKRKIYEGSLFPIPRVTKFVPASGKVSRKQFIASFEAFIRHCFKDNDFNRTAYYPAQSGTGQFNCKWCVYNNKEELCPTQNRI